MTGQAAADPAAGAGPGATAVPAGGFVRTVRGDIAPAALGRIDYHEHLFHASPLLPGEDLDDEGAARTEFTAFLGTGFAGIIDATPIGLGRRPEALARIAAATGGTVVAATGRHRDAHYGPAGWAPGADRLTALFLSELGDGMAASDETLRAGGSPRDTVALGPDGTPVRAGIVKLGIDYWSISATERAAIEAAAAAHAATGAPIMVHTEYCTAAHELLDLFGSLGVAAHRIALAHVDRNPDPGLHVEIADRGAYLGYDGAARLRDVPESTVLACLAEVVSRGGGLRILLGGDVARRSRMTAYGGMPGLAYLPARFVPRVVDALGDDVTDMLLRRNPSRYLMWHRPS